MDGMDHLMITIKDLFLLITMAGKLMNKKDPEDDCTKPFEEFMAHSTKSRSDGMEYVEAADMPGIIYRIFVERPDQKRTDAAEIITSFNGDPEDLTEHVLNGFVNAVWEHYDKDKSGQLEAEEAYQFVGAVLTLKEKALARMSEREP